MYSAKKILKEAAPEAVEAVRKGERSIRSVYSEITEKNRKAKEAEPAPPVQEEMFEEGESDPLKEVIMKISGVIGIIEVSDGLANGPGNLRRSLLIRLREIRAALKGIAAKRSMTSSDWPTEAR
jgi:hypothetical protein